MTQTQNGLGPDETPNLIDQDTNVVLSALARIRGGDQLSRDTAANFASSIREVLGIQPGKLSLIELEEKSPLIDMEAPNS